MVNGALLIGLILQLGAGGPTVNPAALGQLVVLVGADSRYATLVGASPASAILLGSDARSVALTGNV